MSKDAKVKNAESDTFTDSKQDLPSVSQDVVLFRGPTEDGAGVKVLRAKNGEVQLGEVRPLEEGKSIHGEVVELKPNPQVPYLFDVHVQYNSSDPSFSSPSLAKKDAKKRVGVEDGQKRKGPATVTSESYRTNWDRIFGLAKPELLN